MTRNNQQSENVPELAILKEQLKNEKLPALRNAGLIQSDAVRRFLIQYEKNYEPNQAPHYKNSDEQAYYYYNSEEYVETVKQEISEVLSDAIVNGHTQVVQHAIGLQKTDEMGGYLVEYRKLFSFLENNSLSLIIGNSDTGDGKTATMISLVETMLASNEYDVALLNLKSFTENRDDAVYIEKFTEYLQYCIDHPDQRKVLALDEISSVLSGYPSDAADVQKFLRPFLRFKRHSPFNTSIIGVSHSMGDVHPVWRDDSQADFLTKFGDTQEKRQKQFRIYRKHNDSANELYNKQIEITDMNLPKSSWDSDENSTFSFGEEEELLDIAYDLQDMGHGDVLNLLRMLEPEDDDEEQDYSRNYEAVSCAKCGRTGMQYKNQDLHPIMDTGFCWRHIPTVIEQLYKNNPTEFKMNKFNENKNIDLDDSIYNKQISDFDQDDIAKIKDLDQDVAYDILSMIDEYRNDIDIDLDDINE